MDKILAIRRFIWWNITEGEILQQRIEFIHWVGMFQLDEIVHGFNDAYSLLHFSRLFLYIDGVS